VSRLQLVGPASVRAYSNYHACRHHRSLACRLDTRNKTPAAACDKISLYACISPIFHFNSVLDRYLRSAFHSTPTASSSYYSRTPETNRQAKRPVPDFR